MSPHYARHEITQPITAAQLGRAMGLDPARHRRRIDPYTALALVLLLAGVLLVLALPHVGRWVG